MFGAGEEVSGMRTYRQDIDEMSLKEEYSVLYKAWWLGTALSEHLVG